MKLLIQNKLVSMGGSSKITDESGKEVFFVKGKIGSPTKVKYVRDMNKKVLYIVRNKYFHLAKRSAFIYNADKVLYSTVTRNISVQKDYEITGADGNLKIDGTIMGWNFDVIYKGEKVGHIQRKLRMATDAFELDVKDPEDAAFLVAIVIALDNIEDAAEKSNKKKLKN